MGPYVFLRGGRGGRGSWILERGTNSYQGRALPATLRSLQNLGAVMVAFTANKKALISRPLNFRTPITPPAVGGHNPASYNWIVDQTCGVEY